MRGSPSTSLRFAQDDKGRCAGGGSQRGTGAANLGVMKLVFPVESLGFQLSRFAILAFGVLAIAACSKSDLQIVAPPTAQPLGNTTAADRVVEIDRLLAIPLTGNSDEADRRSALRAERDALRASGQVPYCAPVQTFANRNANIAPTNPMSQRSANGNVVNYAAQTAPRGPITVAPNSQASNLSFLEQMTPTEREHYYKTLRLQNTRRVEVDVRSR